MARAVAVAMSGGVDSTVAAILLKRRGFDLVGVYMHNWDQADETGSCSSETDYELVQGVCEQIGIPCRRADLVKEYWAEVFCSLLDGVSRGWTPNPDVVCNQRIKFRAFHDWVTNMLGISTVATGHYARVGRNSHGETTLLQSVDPVKDQTYFLSHVSQEALRNSLFPVGHLFKSEVREIARAEGLDRVNQRKESMGLCFVGKRDFNSFISQYVDSQPGDFVTLTGQVVGTHEGHQLYTIGQRARLGGHHKPYCVVGKDPMNNVVTVVEGTTHPALYTYSFTTLQPHWITCMSRDIFKHSHDSENFSLECLVRPRHQHRLEPCTVTRVDGGLLVNSSNLLRAVTPGQYAVFYKGVECLGGACIDLLSMEHVSVNAKHDNYLYS